MKSQVLAVLMEDRLGILSDLTAVFAEERVDIRSLTIGSTDDPRLARATICARMTDEQQVQLSAALDAMTAIRDVEFLGEREGRHREYAVLQIESPPEARSRVVEMASIFRARLVDASSDSLTFEAVGVPDEIDALHDLALDFGVRSMCRTGPISWNGAAG